jgi:glycosyltransferase involved in cell wall biosynthesis
MDKSMCKRKLGLKENKRYIVFMDSYNRRPFKRLDRFTKTLEILQKQYHVTDLEPLILTNTERSLIPLYLCASDLHLLTSDFEGSPNSVKECLACNIPVVSTPVGNVNDLLRDIEGCYVSRSFDPEELASLADKALKWNNFSSRNSIQGKGLDIKTVAKILLGVYDNIIKQN